MEQRPSASSSQTVNSDEIDFFQLCVTLWEKRLLVFFIAGFTALFAVVFMLLSPDKYRAEARIYQFHDVGLPALSKDLSYFGNASASIELYAFDLLQRYLLSEKTALTALEDPSVEEIVNSSYPSSPSISKQNTLIRSVNVMPPNHKKNRPYILVSLLWGDADDAAQLLTVWVRTAKVLVANELVEIHRNVIGREVSSLEKQIDIEESLAQARIEYEISRLKEAKAIAHDLDLKSGDIVAGDALLASLPQAENVRELRALYLIGSDKLEVEIRALEERKAKADYYAQNVLELSERRGRLLALNMVDNDSVIAAITRSGEVFPSGKKVGLSPVLVVLLSVFIGILLGCMVALIKASFDRKKVGGHG